jgi:putative transcription regulator (tetR family)
MQKQNTHSTYRKELKSRILHTSMHEFKQKGIRSVRMDDIANSLGISKRTLYEIYANKEELLLAGIIEEEKIKEKEAQVFISDDSYTVMDLIIKFYHLKIEELTHTNPLFYSELHKYPRIIKFINRRHHTLDKRNMAFIKRGIQEGYFSPQFNYDIIFQIINGATTVMMTESFFKGYDVQTVFKNVTSFFIRGFCTQKGIREIDTLLSASP